jgi:hypothetical protein
VTGSDGRAFGDEPTFAPWRETKLTTMNFFRSEEHIRNWIRFDPTTEDGIISLGDLVKLFSCRYFRRRLDPDYFSNRLQYRTEFLSMIKDIGKTGPFWQKPEP